MKRFAMILLALALTVTPVYGDDFQDGLDAYESKDYKTALVKLKPLAEKGDADAQFYLGMIYDSYIPLKGPSNLPPSFRELSPEDLNFFRDIFSSQDFLNAQANIGVRKKEAVRWFRSAAQQGHAEAQLNLGVMYAEGKGVPQNYIEAHKWFNISAANQSVMGRKKRSQIEKRMTPEQISKAQKLAREWMENHPKKGKL